MSFPQPSIPNRSTTKPIYIVVAEDPSDASGLVYYKSQDLVETGLYVDLKGVQLTKTQAANTIKDPRATITSKTELKQINRRIPWHRIIRMENITYSSKHPSIIRSTQPDEMVEQLQVQIIQP